MKSSTPAMAWPLVGLGALLVALNEAAGGSNAGIYVVAGACLVAGLIGVVLGDRGTPS